MCFLKHKNPKQINSIVCPMIDPVNEQETKKVSNYPAIKSSCTIYKTNNRSLSTKNTATIGNTRIQRKLNRSLRTF